MFDLSLNKTSNSLALWSVISIGIEILSSPSLVAGTVGQTLGSLVTWGSYVPPSGETLNAPVRQMQIDGGAWVAFVGATVLAEGGVYQVREVISTVQGTDGTFGSLAITVPYVQPTAQSALADVLLPVDPSSSTVETAGDFTGTDLVYALQTAPAGVSISSQTGVVTIVRSSPTSGAVVVRASTPDNKFVDSAFTVDVLVGQITADPAIATARFYDQQRVDTHADYSANIAFGRFTSNVGSIQAANYRQDTVNLLGSDVYTQGSLVDLRVVDDAGTEVFFSIEDAVEYRAQVTVVGASIISDINEIVPGAESITHTISGSTPYDGTYTKTAAEWRVLGHLDGTISVSATASPGVGDSVTVTDRGGWHHPEGRTLSLMVQWLRNSTAIPGETGLDYTFVTEDIGLDIVPQVTGDDGVSQLAVLGPATTVQGGTIFIHASGQSQFDEHEPETPAVTYPGLKMWKGGQVVDAVSPLENLTDGNTGMNMAMKTAQLLAQADPGNEYIIVATVKGGTGLDNEWATGGSRYNEAVSEMQAAMAARPGGTLGYMLGAHGGAAAGMTTDAFRAALATFRTDFCAALGVPEPPMLNGTVYRSTVAIELLNDGIKTIYEAAANFWAVDWRIGLSDIGDNIHLNQAGMALAAARNIEAFGQTTSAAPVLTETNGDLSYTWPAATSSDAGGTYDLYNPTGGRRPVSNVIEYTVNAGAPQTTTIPYGDPLVVPKNPEDDLTARVQVLYSDASSSPFSNTVSWTEPAAFAASYVGTMTGTDNYDQPDPQSFTLTLPISAQTGDDAIIYIANRTADANDSTIGSILVNGDTATVNHNNRTNGNALAVVTHTLSAGDISAGQITASFSSPGASLRSEVTGLVYRGGALNIVAGIDLTNPSSNNTFSLPEGFPMAGLVFKSSSDPLTITGDASIVAYNEAIEGTLKNVFTVVGSDTAVTSTATINMDGFIAGADATGVLAWYG